MIFFFVSLSTYFCYLILKYQKHLGLLQEKKFNLAGYYNNIVKNLKREFLTPEILAIVMIVIVLNTDAKITGISMIIFYILMFLYEIRNFKTINKKNPNMIRTIIFIVIINLLVLIGFIIDNSRIYNNFLFYNHIWIYYIIMIILCYLSSGITLLAGLLNNITDLIYKKIRKKPKKEKVKKGKTKKTTKK